MAQMFVYSQLDTYQAIVPAAQQRRNISPTDSSSISGVINCPKKKIEAVAVGTDQLVGQSCSMAKGLSDI